MNPMASCVGALAVIAMVGCGNGGPVNSPGAPATTVAAPVTTTPAAATSSSRPAPEFALPAYGVEPTTRRALAAGEITCPPPDGPTVTVRGPAPGSPTLTIGIPDGFTEAIPHRDEVRLTGPAGMTAEITLTPTAGDAQDAFDRYSDDRVAKFSIHSVSVLPGDLCGYSGQKLMGTLADQPGKGTQYADRIVHVWTNSGDFLAAVRVEAPSGTSGFDQASSALLADFGIAMPG
ncbi:hypothetical protein [Mycolicibacterium peregrinum]|uniref:hypothetical protein n=1 Tax=Mycolicibacterium peregrinum TaxID=43304 RepID=UPI000A98E1DF|nr:hypothetical protein [Mycolicibacterium peregrinum]